MKASMFGFLLSLLVPLAGHAATSDCPDLAGQYDCGGTESWSITQASQGDAIAYSIETIGGSKSVRLADDQWHSYPSQPGQTNTQIKASCMTDAQQGKVLVVEDTQDFTDDRTNFAKGLKFTRRYQRSGNWLVIPTVAAWLLNDGSEKSSSTEGRCFLVNKS